MELRGSRKDRKKIGDFVLFHRKSSGLEKGRLSSAEISH
jgi:hypothetical protein